MQILVFEPNIHLSVVSLPAIPDLYGGFTHQLSLSPHGLFVKMLVHTEAGDYVQKRQLHLAVEDKNYGLCHAKFCLLGKFKLASSQIFPANLNRSLPRDGNRKNDYYMSSLMFLHQHGHREQSCVKASTFFVCEAPAVPLNAQLTSSQFLRQKSLGVQTSIQWAKQLSPFYSHSLKINISNDL